MYLNIESMGPNWALAPIQEQLFINWIVALREGDMYFCKVAAAYLIMIYQPNNKKT